MKNRVYEAIALSDEFTNGRLYGRISFPGDRLHFTNGDFVKDLSIPDLLITKGGASDGLIFFSNPSRPGLSIYTRDANVINDPVLNANTDIANQLREFKKVSQKKYAVSSTGIMLLAAAIYGIVQFGFF